MLEWEQGVEGDGRVVRVLGEEKKDGKKEHHISCPASFLFGITDSKVAGYL